MALPGPTLEDPLGGMEWPDGPVCPFCGTRERVRPEMDGAFVRVRYDCLRCDRHHGYIRRRPRPPAFPRHRVLPRLPDPGV